MLDNLHVPALVKTPTFQIVAWNRAAVAVLGDYSAIPERDRNMLRRVSHPEGAAFLPYADDMRRTRLAAFRVDVARAGESEEAAVIVDELMPTSEDFRRLWAEHELRTHGVKCRRLGRPNVGELVFETTVFSVDDSGGLSMLVLSPTNDASARGVEQLLRELAKQRRAGSRSSPPRARAGKGPSPRRERTIGGGNTVNFSRECPVGHGARVERDEQTPFRAGELGPGRSAIIGGAVVSAMRVLFLHQNFPGQFGHLARALAQEGHTVRALAISPRMVIPGVDIVRYAPLRNSTRGIAPGAIDFETKTIRAEASAQKMAELDAEGFVPDIVIGHHGWGETWLVKDVWPDVPLLCLKEFYYGADLNFDPEFLHPGRAGAFRFRLKNFGLLPALDTMDWGMSPTAWQRAQFPERYRNKISVAFEGIDSARASPKAISALTIGTPPVRLAAGDEIVSFVSRALEPYRGYHCFMRALPRLLALRPRARVMIVGGDANGYGAPPSTGTWREHYLAEVRERIDASRVHFVGRVAYDQLIDLFRLTSCHVYLTYPFVLSWSMLEAMSTGALVVGSRTGPVEDVLVDGDNGLLVDFFDPEALAQRVAEVLAEPERFASVRARARQTVLERFALERCVPKQLALVHAVSRGELPPAGF